MCRLELHTFGVCVPRKLKSTFDQALSNPQASSFRDHIQVIQNPESVGADTRETWIELRETKWFYAVISQINHAVGFLNALEQEISGTLQVRDFFVKHAVGIE